MRNEKERCVGCEGYITDERLRELNLRCGSELFPLDMEWKNCVEGLEAWLNCRKRKG